jgi:hypothetical protein
MEAALIDSPSARAVKQRQGMIAMLSASAGLIRAAYRTDARPLAMLATALADLNSGRVPSLLKPAVRGSGRPRDDLSKQLTDAVHAACVDILWSHPDYTRVDMATAKAARMIGLEQGKLKKTRQRVMEAGKGDKAYDYWSLNVDRLLAMCRERGIDQHEAVAGLLAVERLTVPLPLATQIFSLEPEFLETPPIIGNSDHSGCVSEFEGDAEDDPK